MGCLRGSNELTYIIEITVACKLTDVNMQYDWFKSRLSRVEINIICCMVTYFFLHVRGRRFAGIHCNI